MHDEHPHPLLAQVPLTVSPFLSLPTAVPLPYSYKTLPSTLPHSILQPNQSDPSQPATPQQQQQPSSSSSAPYVVSASGTSATPDQILASCVALQRHLSKLEADAKKTLGEWQERRRQEDLAEKRRVAPGWLDSGVHIIKPENVDEMTGSAGAGGGQQQRRVPVRDLMDEDPQRERRDKEGEELDRVFGGLKV